MGNEWHLPHGFRYHPDFLTLDQEKKLLSVLACLDFTSFEYKGFVARRRVIAYGWTYNFTSNRFSEAEPIPEFLLDVRASAAEYAGISSDDLAEALLMEYPPGASINWHRDLPMFEMVMGVSLLGNCTMRLRPIEGKEKPLSVHLEPRSLYIMEGTARWQYQHSIPAVKEHRYSITFRSLREPTRRRHTSSQT